MRAFDPARQRNARPTRRLVRDAPKVIIAYVLICGLSAALTGIAYRTSDWSSQSARLITEAALATGSILIVPPSGSRCHERSIDNSTWRIRDIGSVDCTEAMARNIGSDANGRWTGSRVDIIRESFQHKY